MFRHDLATIELTERGRGQVRHVAASWAEAPTIALFPGEPAAISNEQ